MTDVRLEVMPLVRRELETVQGRWLQLLEAASTGEDPALSPVRFAFMIDWFCESVLAELPTLPTPAHELATPTAAGYSCAKHPLARFCSAGRHALIEALLAVPGATADATPTHAGPRVAAMTAAFSSVANRELNKFCAVCAHASTYPRCGYVRLAALRSNR